MLVPLHSEPSNAVEEIDALYDVYTDVIDKWATNVRGDEELSCSPRKLGGLGYGHHAWT